jgi:PAS domain S-box-containing protein
MQRQDNPPTVPQTSDPPEFIQARIGRKFATWTGSLSLKTRAVLLVVVSLVIAIWTLTFSAVLLLERDLTQLLSENFRAVVNNLASDLDRDVRLHTDMLTRLAVGVTPEILADPVKLNSVLDHFSDYSAITFAACFVADDKGTVLAGYPDQSVHVGESVREQSYFRQVLAKGKPAIGAPVFAATTQEDLLIPLAVPIRNAMGATVAVLVGHVSLSDSQLFGQLENLKLGRQGWFIVVSPADRMILGGTDRSRVMTRLPGHGVIPLLDRRFEEGFEGPGITLASIGLEVLTLARKMESTGWMVIASEPTAEAFEPIQDLKRWLYSAAVIISVAMAILLRYFLVRQLAPLQAAAGVIRRMTAGLQPLDAIAVARNDEIGEMISSFNRLASERGRLEETLRIEIAEHEQANKTLRERTERFFGIYQTVGDGIVSVDDTQRIVLFNAAAERIFGYQATDVIGRDLSLLLPERFKKDHVGHIHKFADGGQSNRAMGGYGLIYGVRANGEEFPLEGAVSQSGSGSNLLLTVILRDITERRRSESEREEMLRQLELLSERLETAHDAERGKLAFELHEELGQELMALKMYLQVLPSVGEAPEVDGYRQEALSVAVHAMERIRKLVVNLEPRELKDFGLYAAVRNCCQRNAESAGWTLHLDAPQPRERAPCEVERACLRVLQEIISNVLSHSNASQVWVDLHQTDDALVLRVQANGTDFDPENVDSVDDDPEGPRLVYLRLQMRARSAGGVVDIHYPGAQGVVVSVVFPLTVTTELQPLV